MRHKKLWLGLTLVVALFAAALAYLAWPRGAASPPPLPHPNGYDDFLAAADLVVWQRDFDSDKASQAELRDFLESNHPALAQLRVGLVRECGVPLEYSQRQIEVGGERVQKMRGLGRLLAAEGRLAEKEGRVADAARSYVDAIRLGQEICRGGVLIDRTVGNVLEGSYGIASLAALRARLDPETCHKLIDDLLELDQRREAFERVAAREHDLQDVLIADMGWTGVWNRRTLKKLAQPPQDQARQRYLGVQTDLRLLVIELAIQCHTAEQGSPAEQLSDLAPGYLPAVPTDPQTGGPFLYTRDASGGYALSRKRRW